MYDSLGMERDFWKEKKNSRKAKNKKIPTTLYPD
jgi:hypothetical protein